jgi:hypothetical protein
MNIGLPPRHDETIQTYKTTLSNLNEVLTVSIPPPTFRFLFLSTLDRAGQYPDTLRTRLIRADSWTIMNRTHRNWSHGQSGPRRSGRRSWHCPHELDHHGCGNQYSVSLLVYHKKDEHLAGHIHDLDGGGTREMITFASNRSRWTSQSGLCGYAKAATSSTHLGLISCFLHSTSTIFRESYHHVI